MYFLVHNIGCTHKYAQQVYRFYTTVLIMCMLVHRECRLLSGDQWETVFLLPGDDRKVHMYKEVWQSEVSQLVDAC